MAVSAINFIKELARQNIAQDENFYRRMLYYFELQLPYQTGPGGVIPGISNNFMFPLILPPKAITMDEPFAAEITPTQQGGLYVEESGIVQRTLRIRGNTGFKPRKLKTYGSMGESPPGPAFAVPFSVFPQKVSHSRKLPPVAAADISGHRHFQYLQDSLFRVYADLKRDPVTAKDTAMFFHNPKDDEHWRVIPRRFTMERDSSQPTLYNYNIELTIVGPAEAGTDLDFDDKSWLDDFNNAIQIASMGANLTSGAINDLTAMADDIGTQISNITVLIDNTTTILTATQDFIDGNKALIDLPHAWVISNAELLEAAASLTVEDPDQTVPPWVTNKIRTAVDGLELIASNPSSFETPNTTTITDIRGYQDLRRTVSQEKQTEVTDSNGPSSFVELEQLGTGLTPGEVTSSAGSTLAGGDILKYRNLQKVEVGQGDTLASLAAQHLGDARLWQYIATANGIKPPYVNDQASTPLIRGNADESLFGHSLGIGSEILIPTNAASPKDYPLLPVLGTQIDEPTNNMLLGIDAKLEVANGATGDSMSVWDVAIDTENGSTDVKTVEGMDNIEQAVTMRLLTEYGTDTLYKKVGLKRIVGLNFKFADLANARYRLRDAVSADARVATISDLRFDQSEDGDGLITELTAQLRGFAESRSIKVAL